MHAEVIINVTAEKSFETSAQDNYDFYILHVLLNSQIHFPSSGGGGGVYAHLNPKPWLRSGPGVGPDSRLQRICLTKILSQAMRLCL